MKDKIVILIAGITLTLIILVIKLRKDVQLVLLATERIEVSLGCEQNDPSYGGLPKGVLPDALNSNTWKRYTKE